MIAGFKCCFKIFIFFIYFLVMHSNNQSTFQVILYWKIYFAFVSDHPDLSNLFYRLKFLATHMNYFVSLWI